MYRWSIALGVTLVCLLWLTSCLRSSQAGQTVQHDKSQSQDPAHGGHTRSPDPDPWATWVSSTSSSKPNVLFIIADDLRPKLGCYGDTNMVTPNLDYLASKSVRFHEAFVQMAVCSPSRTSFLTGRRPLTTRVLDLRTYFRNVAGNFTTLPEHFKNHGYITLGAGKIFHEGQAAGNTDDFPYSWSRETFYGDQPFNSTEKRQTALHPVNETESGKLVDRTVAEYAVNFLREHAQNNREQPFFLAVGFYKPHLPWIFPQEYLDLYPWSNIRLAQNRTRPRKIPDFVWSRSYEIRSYGDIRALDLIPPNGVFQDHDQYALRQAYSAATSFTDAMVGKVLEALEQNDFSGNTIVSFLGDHGWHLGDNAVWGKHTNYDMALRIPMMVYVPGVTSVDSGFRFIDALAPDFSRQGPKRDCHGNGHSTSELVEAVDLYPTLTELAGLPTPDTCPEQSQDVSFCTEGTSLVPLIRRVRKLYQQGEGSFSWKKAAHSIYPKGWNQNFSISVRGFSMRTLPKPVMGYSMRTKNFRYTEWVVFNKTDFRPRLHQVKGRELYNHINDPYEINNLARNPNYKGIVTKMSQEVRDGWRRTLQEYLDSVQP